MNTTTTCVKCGYEWNYTGRRTHNTTCPKCRRNVNLSSKIKHSALLDLENEGATISSLYEDYTSTSTSTKKKDKDKNRFLIIDFMGTRVIGVNTI